MNHNWENDKIKIGDFWIWDWIDDWPSIRSSADK